MIKKASLTLMFIISLSILIWSISRLNKELKTLKLQEPAVVINPKIEVPNDDFEALLHLYENKIAGLLKDSNSEKRSAFLWSFLMAVFSAAATGVTTLKAIRERPGISIENLTLIIAGLTFGSTCSNFLSDHYSDENDAVMLVITEKRKQAESFINEYQKETDATKKAAIVLHYHRILLEN